MSCSRKESRRLYSREKRQKEKEAGICTWCHIRQARPDGVYCPDCLPKSKEALRKLRDRRDVEKKCRRCGLTQDRPKGLCSGCLEEERLLTRARKEQGLCSKCGREAIQGKTLCPTCRSYRNRQSVLRKENLKRAVMEHYGGCRCACCGEEEMTFLTIDHIHGGGNEHRRSLKARGAGHQFYAYLKRQNYPSGYQVLCFNCNFGKWCKGICPHKLEEKVQPLCELLPFTWPC